MPEYCPRCDRPVYFAEEILALSQKWHKLCFKCGNCNKLLDSTTCTGHDGDAFCKACYGKLFGPKGYGFASGASGLSMDTGRPYHVTRDNVSHIQTAQIAPKLNNGTEKPRFGSANGCPRCGKQVYFAEEKRALGKKWHKICLSCHNTSKIIKKLNKNNEFQSIVDFVCFDLVVAGQYYNFRIILGRIKVKFYRNSELIFLDVSTYQKAQAAPLINGSEKFGGGNMCPKCGKSVYFAEEVNAMGKKYHKLCLRCGNCNKMLDSTTCTDHGNDVYCKNCYGKLFGPKGYGFAGGASGLSMDTGNPDEVTRENVSSLSIAQAAPLLPDTKQNAVIGGGDICPRCGKAVYFAEKVFGGGQTYHKSCFKCTACGKGLDSTTLTHKEDEVFCRSCYAKYFGPKGFGFGQTLQHTG
ncbi:Hypothetical predicted protein [Mytilus galloprovincialis]|uniref:LIM zinc-binding domain-containing protein n=1 Tax=Mytilus galloprovincialis TaxID=29158 RepID=A0A8B6CNC8_MYTGA|nr:Hypothetical predicted protein [Mytilus galloprovincialis]